MVFWWIVSVMIVLGSIAFALYNLYGSYKVQTFKKEAPERYRRFSLPVTFPLTKQQVITSLKLKLQAVENNSQLYYNELQKLQQRIQILERNSGAQPQPFRNFGDENWEEMYYKIYDEKEKLESELDITTQKLEEAEAYTGELIRREKEWKQKISDLEIQLNRAQSLQNKIGELQQDLEGAYLREAALQQELAALKDLQKDFDMLQQQYSHIQSEADELRSRILDINTRDILLQKKINRLTEIESSNELSEYEKMDLKKTVEEIIIENEALAAKLQELQEKLHSEKYV